MKSYGQYCPIAKAVEVLGERWSLLVMRELLIGSTTFNDISRGLPAMSRSMLSKRLRELEQAGIVERLDGGYHLTPAGAELRPIVFGLGDWCAKWLLEDPLAPECDPDVLMWWGHPRLDTSPLPDRRVVLRFLFPDHSRQMWVVIEDMGCSVCLHDPGYELDATITADSTVLTKVWFGRQTVQSAIKAGEIKFEGTPAITRRLPQVLTIDEAVAMGATPEAPTPTRFVQ
jgi:DNA-binding HxlR family transcriptional regulator